MTVEELRASEPYQRFLADLKQTRRAWRLDGGALRLSIINSVTCCPLTAMIQEDVFRWPIGARQYNINRDDAVQIVQAADSVLPHSPLIRADLLAATEATA